MARIFLEAVNHFIRVTRRRLKAAQTNPSCTRDTPYTFGPVRAGASVRA